MDNRVLELGHLSTHVELTHAPVRFVKEIIRAGVYDYPGRPGEKIEITRRRMEEWVNNFYTCPARVWIPYRHSSDPQDNTGWVEDLFADGDRLFAVMRITDERAAELLRDGTVRDVSVGIEKDFVDMGGRRYGEVVRHVALTLDPHIRAQEGFALVGSVANEREKGSVELDEYIYAFVDAATGEGFYPHHDDDGDADLAAVRRALEELATREEDAVAEAARPHLLAHLREAGQTVNGEASAEGKLELEARVRKSERLNRTLRRRIREMESDTARRAEDDVDAEVAVLEAEGKVLPSYAPHVRALLASGPNWRLEFDGRATSAGSVLREMFQAMPAAVEWGERLTLCPPAEKAPVTPAERRMLETLGIAEEDYRRLGHK